ncbi:MAG: DUF3160 domain-containing protein [Treponema sp.]|nr:DUF3160 domain-containing protein [Treponema sp.]
MKRTFLFIIACFLTFTLLSCKKNTETAIQIQEEELKIVEIKLPEPTETENITEIDLEAFLEAFKASKNGTKAEAHKKYLNDMLTFLPIPTPAKQSKRTALVTSSFCKLYPIQNITTDEEAKNLKNGIPIPIGTVLNISDEKLEAQNKEDWYNGLFEYEKCYNWFYKTEYEGQKGIVFGADLFLGDTNRNNILSLLYKSKSHFDKFYPICGYNNLSPEIQTTLHTNRIALQEVAADEYYLDTETPDDMVSLYMNHLSSQPFGWQYSSMGKNITPLFITTDLFAHTQHLIFDEMLQHIEETAFKDKLINICDSYIAKLSDLYEQTIDTAENIGKKNTDSVAENSIVISSDETIEKAILYFKTARALLELAPKKEINEPEKAVDRFAVFAKYPESVKKEIELMESASGLAYSSVFSFSDGTKYKEDYSQYKPRGHYTKNERLKSYFRAMMWFGRINFSIADPNSLKNEQNKRLSESQILALRMTPIAILITDITSKDEHLFETWRNLFEPITALIGKSDDLSFLEVIPLWQEQNVSNVTTWITDTKNIIKFAETARNKLEPPAIAGNSLFYANQYEGNQTDAKNIKQAMGWRLFGQRFTYDSWIHHKVSAPRLITREMVSGLDIMKALGSNTADLYLRDEYDKHPNLKSTLNEFEEFFAKKDETFWTNNYYNMVLFEAAAQSRFEPGSGFYFTETPKWAIKAMLSSHGTWAELRHDTLLYVKQSYSEKGGNGDCEPTYRAEKLPQTVHYIEPNIPFFQGYKLANILLKQTYQRFGLLDNNAESTLNALNEIADKALQIATLELNDQPVPEEQLAWIPTIPAEFAKHIMIYQSHFGYSDSNDQFKMAVIADVFTNAEIGLVLETGVGIPYRIYVALNDGQGGKRIAVGYTFSYFEFPHPMDDRLTDEIWRETVYSGQSLEAFKPFWCQNQTLKAAGFDN